MPRLYIHPLPVRIWHWINALGFVTLILTGIHIRYADLIGLIPFATAVRIHNYTGLALIANYFVWLSFYLFTDKITVYHPELNPKKYFRAGIQQAIYYGYGIFKGAPNPHHVSAYHKFNALQAITYQIVMMILVPIQFYTGILLWDLERFQGSVEFLGGVRVVATVHVMLFIFFVAYVFGHAYLGSLGHTASAHFKAMVTGYEDIPDEPVAPAKAGENVLQR
jgi:thiosulfate reductase cytochrome b subunit